MVIFSMNRSITIDSRNCLIYYYENDCIKVQTKGERFTTITLVESNKLDAERANLILDSIAYGIANEINYLVITEDLRPTYYRT